MIKSLKAREILDSRGKPTVEVKLETGKGVFVASVPSGASRGKHEAVEIKAAKAVKNINEIIALKLKGKDPTKQKEIDELMIELDATENKSKLGANAILAVSIAICRAGAAAENIPLYQHLNQLIIRGRTSDNGSDNLNLPRPCFNIINGGAHADNYLEIQEFMVIPQKDSFRENFQRGKEVYKNLKAIFKKEFGEKGIIIGDEGGFSPPIKKDADAFEFLRAASNNFKDIKLGLDCAATQLYRKGEYELDEKKISREEFLNFYLCLTKKYPIIFFEDPFSEEDWEGWKMIKSKMGRKILIIGDDLTVTNKELVIKAINEKAIDGIIVKPNQIGTVTETIETVKVSRKAGLKIIISHRSGETLDDFIADLAVGIGADFIKSGAPAPKERIAKYNRLLKIEEELKKN